MDRNQASKALRRIAALMDVHGENPYRSRAFANAARAVEVLQGDLDAMVSSGEILEVRGIGRSTAEVLAELSRGIEPSVLGDLETRTPAGVLEMMQLDGVGPKRVHAIWRDLGVETLGELNYACHENRLADLKGFGATMQARVLESLRFRQRVRDRHLIHDAWEVAAAGTARLEAVEGVERVLATGELRRGCETVATVELMAVTGRPSSVVHELRRAGSKVIEAGEHVLDVELGDDGGVCRVHVVEPAAAGATLAWTTGSDQHRGELQRLADERGLKLRPGEGQHPGQATDCAAEEEIFAALGLAWIPPELREGEGELALAARNELPDLVSAADLCGAVHNHTTDSDGVASLKEMAEAAARAGWEYIGIADHSPIVVYANGVSAERLRDQGRRIDALNAEGGVRVLKGLEADILADGTLDLPEEAADDLDYVVASVHTAFRLTAEAQTTRIVEAVRNPATRILGHPTGRLLLARPGYEVDLDVVLDACAECGVAVEINASPYRLDLEWRWARSAIERGIDLIVNPDAHSIEGLDNLRWGLTVARKAGAGSANLLNTLSADELLERFRR